MSKEWRSYLKKMGPAWVISAVACGPATLASVSIAGAFYGFQYLWVVILSAVFGATAQYLAAKIGIIEGRGIIGITEKYLGRKWALILAFDAIIATYIAALVLMNALVGITSLATHIHTPWWGIFYAVLISVGIIKGGYKGFENICKLLVVFIVLCFIITMFQADISVPLMLKGLIPRIPQGMDSAMMMAAIMGGAVHITIIGMHTYNTNERKWTKDDLGLARFDTILSMGVAFGIYSLAIYIVAASVLYPHHIKIKGATDAAMSLGPLLGKSAMMIFLVGLWGATLSTISPTFLASAYFIFDMLRWRPDSKDKRFHVIVVIGTLLSAAGPFIKGSFFLLLPLMLALGLCGTPLIIAIILYILNKREVVQDNRNSIFLNILGSLTLIIITLLAIRFIMERMGII